MGSLCPSASGTNRAEENKGEIVICIGMRGGLLTTAFVVLALGVLIRIPAVREPAIKYIATLIRSFSGDWRTASPPSAYPQPPLDMSKSIPAAVTSLKTVGKKVLSVEQADGDGARVRRSIGTRQLSNLDPFLMLDEFAVTAPAGFPDHPHRGFETATYMLSGTFQHEDFTGRRGIIEPGDLQWMTAGRGIVHAEMPASPPGVTCRGLQLWINLPAEHKMCEPRYQELKDADVPRARSEDGSVEVKVIAGESMGVTAAVRTFTPIFYLDFQMKPGARFVQAVPAGYTTFAYTLKGSVRFADGGAYVDPHTTVVFSAEGEAVSLEAATEGTEDGYDGAHFVLIAGEPIGEPIVQHGPFVMNEKDEIYEAFDDFRSGKNGAAAVNPAALDAAPDLVVEAGTDTAADVVTATDEVAIAAVEELAAATVVARAADDVAAAVAGLVVAGTTKVDVALAEKSQPVTSLHVAQMAATSSAAWSNVVASAVEHTLAMPAEQASLLTTGPPPRMSGFPPAPEQMSAGVNWRGVIHATTAQAGIVSKMAVSSARAAGPWALTAATARTGRTKTMDCFIAR
ncbi:hypothetical protein HK101_011804 [Irineochytrium annulatum]|nr:hypothetical protein HK101_011804 [Irineochytrium annulatum]